MRNHDCFEIFCSWAVLLVVLKLFGAVDWAWGWVLIPVWIVLVVVAVSVILEWEDRR